jgi:hypothetical protein
MRDNKALAFGLIVALLVAVLIAVSGGQAGPASASREPNPDYPSSPGAGLFPEHLLLTPNPRQPQGEIVQIEGDMEYDDAAYRVSQFLFGEGAPLREYVVYQTVDEDGIPRLGVTSSTVIPALWALNTTIRFEVFDPVDIAPLDQAAREIAKKPSVFGASYHYGLGRVVVFLKPDYHDHYEDIYDEYPDVPLGFLMIGEMRLLRWR